MSGQERFAEERYFGPVAIDQDTDDASPQRRRLHPEEAQLYAVTNNTAGALTVTTPKDCRNLRTGFQFAIVHETGSGNSILVKNHGETVTLLTIAVGEFVRCWLTDNSTADGVWRFKATSGGKQTART